MRRNSSIKDVNIKNYFEKIALIARKLPIVIFEITGFALSIINYYIINLKLIFW